MWQLRCIATGGRPTPSQSSSDLNIRRQCQVWSRSTFSCCLITFLPCCLHCTHCGLATRKLSVCLSVRLFVKRVDCDKTEERSVQIFIPYERSGSVVFWEKEWLVGAIPSIWNFGPSWLRWSEPECLAMAQNGSHSGSWELNYSNRWAKYVNSFRRIED